MGYYIVWGGGGFLYLPLDLPLDWSVVTLGRVFRPAEVLCSPSKHLRISNVKLVVCGVIFVDNLNQRWSVGEHVVVFFVGIPAPVLL